jgi:hypothetical protein
VSATSGPVKACGLMSNVSFDRRSPAGRLVYAFFKNLHLQFCDSLGRVSLFDIDADQSFPVRTLTFSLHTSVASRRWKMPQSAVRTFTDPDAYFAGIRNLSIDGLVTGRGKFLAETTLINLDRLQMGRGLRQAGPGY